MNIRRKTMVPYQKEETFDEKIERLESLPSKTYFEELKINKDDLEMASMFPLYHGLRFNSLEKLESIFKDNYVYCGNKINKVYYNDIENCNMGEYVSVTPYSDGVEFNVFVRENIFLVFKGNIEAINTYYLNYEDYVKLRESKRKTNNLYSYAFNEYLVKDSISLDDLLYVGIDSNFFRSDINEVIEKVTSLMKQYNINADFIDISNNNVIYSGSDNYSYIK